MKLNGQRKQRKGCSSLLYAVYFFFLFTSRTSLCETTSCVLFCITAHSIKTQSTLKVRGCDRHRNVFMEYVNAAGVCVGCWMSSSRSVMREKNP